MRPKASSLLSLPVLLFHRPPVHAMHNGEGIIQLYGNAGTTGEWIEVYDSATDVDATFDLMWEMDGEDPNHRFDIEIYSWNQTCCDDLASCVDTPVHDFQSVTVPVSYYPTADHSIYDMPIFSLAGGKYCYRLRESTRPTDWYSSTLRSLADSDNPTAAITSPAEMAIYDKGETVTFTLEVSDDTLLNRATVYANGEYEGVIGLKVNSQNKLWPSEGDTHVHTWSYAIPSNGKTEDITFEFFVTDLFGRGPATIPTRTINIVRGGDTGGGGGEGTGGCVAKGDPCPTEGVCCSGVCRGSGNCG